jgi:hypothetical protein
LNKLSLRAILLNNKPKIRKFEGKDIEITRAAAGINPLMTYNFTGNSDGIFPNDVLTTHGDYGFVGGDTVEYTFDFGTKIANSVAECPMKYYYGVSPTLNSPIDTPKWFEATSQSYLDRLKSQDSSVDVSSSALSGNIVQMMVELDLTPLCNKFYGGSNAAMKAALKSIQADVWAMGSGANAGVSANGVKAQGWNVTNSVWSNAMLATNTTSSIAKMTTQINVNPTMSEMINSSNKLYILIASQYASDGTIASSVSLDYLSIKVSLARTVDTVKPKQVYLPKYWAMVVKGWSPCFEVSGAKANSRIVDIGNKFDLRISSTNKFQFTKYGDTTSSLMGASIDFIKNQSYNFIFGQTVNGMFIKFLKNNGSVIGNTNTDIQEVKGLFDMYFLTRVTTGYETNAFTEAFHLIDLQAIGKIRFGQELVTNGDFSNGGTGWTVGAGTWNFSSGKAVLTASASGQYAYPTPIYFVTPNTKYLLSGEFTGGIVRVRWYSDTIGSAAITDNDMVVSGSMVVTAPSNANGCRIFIRNGTETSGTFTFDNISLKQILQDGFTDAEAEGILRGVLKGKNLFDKSKARLDGYYNDRGAFITGTGNYATDYIPITQGKTYCHNRGVNAYINYYDINKNWVSAVSAISFTVPQGAFYMITSCGTAQKTVDQFQIEEGSVATAYESYMENPLGIVNKNLFSLDKATLKNNAKNENGNLIITQTETVVDNVIDCYMSALPNNKYSVGTLPNGLYVHIREYYNDIQVKYSANMQGKELVLSEKTNKVRYSIGSQAGSQQIVITPEFKLKM